MANAQKNIFMAFLSGTIGRQMTLSQKAGSTIAGKKRGPSLIPATEDQLDVQSRFRIASKYALAAILDPVTKAAYAAVARKGQSAYNVALADAFTPPEIISINTAGFHGLLGDSITIRAVDYFKVVSVRVRIHDSAGVLAEDSNAVLQSNGLDWVYRTTSVIGNPIGTKITVTATDLPANETVKELVIPA